MCTGWSLKRKKRVFEQAILTPQVWDSFLGAVTVNEEGFVYVLINKLLFLFRGMFWLCVVGRRGKWWFLKNCYNCGPSEGICLKRSKYISFTIGILPLIYIWHSFQWLRTHTCVRRENPLSPKYLIQVKLELRLKIFNPGWFSSSFVS